MNFLEVKLHPLSFVSDNNKIPNSVEDEAWSVVTDAIMATVDP